MKINFGLLMAAVIVFAGNSFSVAGDSGYASAGLGKIFGLAAATPVVLESTSVIRDAQGKRTVLARGMAPLSLQLSRFKVANGVEDIRVSPAGNIIVKSTAELTVYGPNGNKLKTLEGNAIYLSDNSKYFAVVNSTMSPRNPKRVKTYYVRLHDENGALLWERESQNLSFVRLSKKGDIAFFPGIEDSSSANIFDANGSVITPANMFINGNFYDLSFSDSAHSYLLRKVVRERVSGNRNVYTYNSSMHVFSINGVELFATKPVKEDAPTTVATMAVNDSEAFVFSETIFGKDKSDYTYADVSGKSFRKMEGFDGYFLQYAKHLGNNKLAVFTRDSFIIWDLSENIPISEYFLNGNSDNRPHDKTSVLFDTVMQLNDKFYVLAMGPHASDYSKGHGFVFVFDLMGRKVEERVFPMGEFIDLGKSAFFGDRLVFGTINGASHSLRIE